MRLARLLDALPLRYLSNARKVAAGSPLPQGERGLGFARFSLSTKEKAPAVTPGPCRCGSLLEPSRLAAVAEELEQHHEQVDEVEIEPERSHHRLAAGDRAVVARIVRLLDLLRVVGRQA